MPPIAERVDFFAGNWGKTGFVVSLAPPSGFVGSWDTGPALFSEKYGPRCKF